MRLTFPKNWESWFGWPWLLSAWFHLLLVSYPVAVGDHAPSPSTSGAPRLEVRLGSRTSPESRAAISSVAGDATSLPARETPATDSRSHPAQVPADATEISLIVPNRYFKSTEVDEKAEPVDVAPLIYPEEAYLRRLSGRVTLRLYINEGGGVDSIDVVEAEPAGLFDQAAIDATLATRFRPASLLARPVKSIKTIVVRFDPLADQ